MRQVIFLRGWLKCKATEERVSCQPAGWQKTDAEWHWKLFYYGAIYKTITLICAPFNSASLSLDWQSISGCFSSFSATQRNSTGLSSTEPSRTESRQTLLDFISSWQLWVEMNPEARRYTRRKCHDYGLQQAKLLYKHLWPFYFSLNTQVLYKFYLFLLV